MTHTYHKLSDGQPYTQYTDNGHSRTTDTAHGQRTQHTCTAHSTQHTDNGTRTTDTPGSVHCSLDHSGSSWSVSREKMSCDTGSIIKMGVRVRVRARVRKLLLKKLKVKNVRVLPGVRENVELTGLQDEGEPFFVGDKIKTPKYLSNL